MHLTQLEYFRAVVKNGSISAAANSLFVSQSAVSKQIGMLEKELGVQLFDRGFRQIRLTESGQLIYDCLNRCTEDFLNSMDMARTIQNGHGDLLRVGYVEYWDNAPIIRSIMDYMDAHGKSLQLTMEPYKVSELADTLARGNIDMALSFDSAFSWREDVNTVPLGTLECGLLYGKAFFNHGKPVRSDFEHIPFLETDDTSHPYRQELRMIMERYGFNNPIRSCPRFSSMVAKVSAGRGVILVSRWAYLIGQKSLGFFPLGKDLPVSAAYFGSPSDGRMELIREVIQAVKTMM